MNTDKMVNEIVEMCESHGLSDNDDIRAELDEYLTDVFGQVFRKGKKRGHRVGWSAGQGAGYVVGYEAGSKVFGPDGDYDIVRRTK